MENTKSDAKKQLDGTPPGRSWRRKWPAPGGPFSSPGPPRRCSVNCFSSTLIFPPTHRLRVALVHTSQLFKKYTLFQILILLFIHYEYPCSKSTLIQKVHLFKIFQVYYYYYCYWCFSTERRFRLRVVQIHQMEKPLGRLKINWVCGTYY